MWDELSKQLATLEFENYGWLRITGHQWTGSTFECTVVLSPGESGSSLQHWVLTCADVRTFLICAETTYDVHRSGSHPLLKPYTELQTTLAISGKPIDPPAAVAQALWEEHQRITQGWFPFEQFLNRNLPLVQILGLSPCVLAEGPESLLYCYAIVLQRFGIEPRLLLHRQPQRRQDGAWVPEREDLEVVVSGKSYVIGADFGIQRMS